MVTPRVKRIRNGAFTLTEVMVVITIIVVIAVAVVIPALQNASDASRVTMCMNNQRQVGLGLQQYVNDHDSYPHSVTWEGYPDFESNDLSQHLSTVAGQYGSTKEVLVQPLHSWVVDILPYIDQQQVCDDFDRKRPYHDATVRRGKNNVTPTKTDIGILVCPSDSTALEKGGNLSYVCNSGFNHFWYSFNGWDSAAGAGNERASIAAVGRIDWDKGANPSAMHGGTVAKKTGLMWPGTREPTAWSYKTKGSAITDGASNTLMIAENTLAGASNGKIYTSGGTNSQRFRTNWACAHPNYVAYFISDDVCTGTDPTTCTSCSTVGDLDPDLVDDVIITGSGYKRANDAGAAFPEAVGLADSRDVIEGGYPFINSNHSGVFVATFVDGACRPISNTIDGRVLAALQTPAGGSLPPAYQQSSVSEDLYR